MGSGGGLSEVVVDRSGGELYFLYFFLYCFSFFYVILICGICYFIVLFTLFYCVKS